MTAFPVLGTLVLATVLAIIAVLTILRFGIRQGLGAVAATLLVVGLVWFGLDRLDMQGKAEQRRAIEGRLTALNAQALLPNSNLSCLDAAGGDLVHEACERLLFASPEQVATALNYVAARLDVLRDIAELPDHDEKGFETLRGPIVRSLEADRFGLVAQVLMARDDCKPASCYAFDFLKRHDQLVANMNEGAYDARVTRFAVVWNDKPGMPSAPALAAQAAAPSPPSPPHTPVNIDFPTADSIPAVSIMSNEPGRPGQNGVGAPPKPEAARSEPRSEPRPEARVEPQPEARPESRPEPRAEPRPQASSPPPRRPAQKAQAPRPAAPPPPPAAVADPFPPPVGSGPQTTGAQRQ
jgi:hypothetical protein